MKQKELKHPHERTEKARKKLRSYIHVLVKAFYYTFKEMKQDKVTP